MSDIVERLRARDAYLSLDEADDEIERLRGLLREAADDKLLSVAIELGTTKARLAEASLSAPDALFGRTMLMVRRAGMTDTWNRCDECGRFIALEDFADGKATHTILEPSSDLGRESWETLCAVHSTTPTVPVAPEAK